MRSRARFHTRRDAQGRARFHTRRRRTTTVAYGKATYVRGRARFRTRHRRTTVAYGKATYVRGRARFHTRHRRPTVAYGKATYVRSRARFHTRRRRPTVAYGKATYVRSRARFHTRRRRFTACSETDRRATDGERHDKPGHNCPRFHPTASDLPRNRIVQSDCCKTSVVPKAIGHAVCALLWTVTSITVGLGTPTERRLQPGRGSSPSCTCVRRTAGRPRSHWPAVHRQRW